MAFLLLPYLYTTTKGYEKILLGVFVIMLYARTGARECANTSNFALKL